MTSSTADELASSLSVVAWAIHNGWNYTVLGGNWIHTDQAVERLEELVAADLKATNDLVETDAGRLLGIQRNRASRLFSRSEAAAVLAPVETTIRLYDSLARHMLSTQTAANSDSPLLGTRPLDSVGLLELLRGRMHATERSTYAQEIFGPLAPQHILMSCDSTTSNYPTAAVVEDAEGQTFVIADISQYNGPQTPTFAQSNSGRFCTAKPSTARKPVLHSSTCW